MSNIWSLKACPVAVLPVPGWECFFGQHDLDFYDLTFYVWIVRQGDTVGLIDTGLPLDPAERKQLQQACQQVDEQCVFRDVVSLDALLRRERIDPDEIDFVLITQTITYHSGGLTSDLMPDADVWMSKAGVLEMLLDNPGHPPRAFYFTDEGWGSVRHRLIADRLHLVDEPTVVRPGITFETTGGHHPGSAGVKVETDAGTVGILETAFLQRNIDDRLPIGIAEDAAACRNAIKRYIAECDIVVADHDPDNAQRFRG